MTPQILSIIIGVSGFFGLLSLLVYLFVQSKINQEEKSVRNIIGADALFTAREVLKILKQFKDDEVRLKALIALTKLDESKSRQLLSKVKEDIDIESLSLVNQESNLRYSRNLGVFFIIIALLGLAYSEMSKLDDSPDPVEVGVISEYIGKSKDVERDWMATLYDDDLCEGLGTEIGIVLRKLKQANDGAALYKTKLRRQLYIFRLTLFKELIKKKRDVTLDSIKNADAELVKLIKLSDVSKKDQAAKDWYLENEYGGIILGNRIFVNALKFVVDNDSKHIDDGAVLFSKLKSDYAGLLKGSHPMEDQFWKVITSRDSSGFKFTCSGA